MTVLLYAGELVSADAQLRRLENTCGEQFADLMTLLRAQHARLAGDLAGARSLLVPLASTEAAPPVRPIAVAFLVETLVESGEIESAAAKLGEYDFDELMASAQITRPLFLAARGILHFASGRFPEAVEDFLSCMRLPVTEMVALSAVMRRRGLAALAADGAGGRQRLSATLATQEEEAALAWGSPAYVGWALYTRAMVERSEETTRLLDDAIDLMDVARSRVGLANACYALGTRLAASGNETAAKEKLERAARLARQIGNAKLADRAHAALHGLAQNDQLRSLTTQELKIAELARAGYSNKQIAERLFLAVRTIEFHLSNVYRKLQISGRRELMDGTLKLL
ncbi:helix-turn-helix transcriptional regulator [Amycolatopsis japonica]